MDPANDTVIVAYKGASATIKYIEWGGDEGYVVHSDCTVMSDAVCGTVGDAVDDFIRIVDDGEWYI